MLAVCSHVQPFLEAGQVVPCCLPCYACPAATCSRKACGRGAHRCNTRRLPTGAFRSCVSQCSGRSGATASLWPPLVKGSSCVTCKGSGNVATVPRLSPPRLIIHKHTATTHFLQDFWYRTRHLLKQSALARVSHEYMSPGSMSWRLCEHTDAT